jgi:integrase
LTVKKIEKLIQSGRHRDERGLYLQVKSPSNRSWIFRYEKDGRERQMGLGSLSAGVSLEIARAKAIAVRQQIAEGLDPLLERQKREAAQQSADAALKARAFTFEQVAQDFYNDHNEKWRNRKHAAQFLSTLKMYAYPVLGPMIVADIQRAHVLRVLRNDDFWTVKPETADRVRARIEAVLDYAAARDLREERNPARWKGNLSQLLPDRSKAAKEKHHAALSYAAMPAFMVKLREREAIAARALEFVILTAARTGEVIGARWDEISIEDRVWVVPADRMKANREHRVPLTDEAIALLRVLPKVGKNPFVFIGQRTEGLSNMAMAVLLKRMKMEEVTVHGFRATFKTWTAERTSYPRDLAEAALAHVSGDKVEQAYMRGDMLGRRREMMTAWAKFCGKPFDSTNVVTLSAAPQVNAA